VPALLGEHDVLIYPSTDVEAYSLGLLEGLASEALIVTSAVGGPREYLRDERNALIVEPGDAAGFARALSTLATTAHSREMLRDGARETSRSLSLDSVVEDLEALLRETVD
jgi:glycosyltransferase involved in cell wall biosynthesis